MRFLFLFIFFIIGSCIYATDVSFVVYHSKGTVMKTGAKTPLKKGDQLLLKDAVTLGSSSQLVLLCSNYKVIQINKAGAYPVKTLLGLCNKNAASYNSAYFKYVWEQFTSPEGSPDKNPTDYMKNVGAVSRGCNEVATSMRSDTTHFYRGELPVFWNSIYKTSYAVVYDQLYDGAVLKKIPLKKDQPFLLGDLLRGLPAGNYYWQVAGSEGSACERKYVQVWEKKVYKKSIASLVKDIPKYSQAEKAFATAFTLQENFFMAEALTWYKKAAKQEPNNPIYNKAIESFYEKNF